MSAGVSTSWSQGMQRPPCNVWKAEFLFGAVLPILLGKLGYPGESNPGVSSSRM